MPAIGTLTAADAAATPVNHNFVPSKVDGDIARYNEKSSSIAAGFWPLSISLRAPLANSTAKVYRCQLSLAIPVTATQTINGVTSTAVTHTNRVNVEFILSADGIVQERKDIRKLLVNLLNDPSVMDVVENLNNVY